MFSFLSGVAGGIVAWIATMLVGQPLYAFSAMRSEVAKLLHLKFLGPLNIQSILAEGRDLEQSTLADCGARLMAFASTQPIARWIVESLGFDPRQAGTNLIKLAGESPEDSPAIGSQVALALKIRMSFKPDASK